MYLSAFIIPKQGSQTSEAKRPPKHLLLRMLDRLINVPFCNLFPFTSPYITSVLPLDQEIAFIRKEHFFSIHFQSNLCIFLPTLLLSFHCNCQKLLFEGFFSFSTHCNQSPLHLRCTYLDSWTTQIICNLNTVF